MVEIDNKKSNGNEMLLRPLSNASAILVPLDCSCFLEAREFYIHLQ
jgi:hypothetical protein